MVAVEAQAAGKPVVAYGRGGACETVVDGVTGVLFATQSAEDVAAAIAACQRIETRPEDIAKSAERFSCAAFRTGMTRAIGTAAPGRRDPPLIPEVAVTA